jgi:DtxR family Mn-dependent transcriptional regulator
MMMMTQSLEDYLEMVSFLSDEGQGQGQVRVTDIAARLGFSKPSVLTALKLLEERGLVLHEYYGRVTITDKGRKLASEIRERHVPHHVSPQAGRAGRHRRKGRLQDGARRFA